MNDELLYQIALTKIPKVGAITARSLISYCGGVEAVFRTPKKQLLKIPNIGETIAQNIIQQDTLKQAEAEISFIEKNDIEPIFYLDKRYPKRLRHQNDAPLMLFHKGNADLNHHRMVSIVGTRKPTERGRQACEDIVEALKPHDVVVVSGLAYGIDITAHRKAVELDIETVGILGHGLSMIYPAAHQQTAEKMMLCGGLITEFTSTVGPHRDNFPARNRIIAALADAVIVVETARSGGSIITAKIANDYNKDVFAIPGRLKDKYSEGCNMLIKTNLAHLMESVDDIAYIMRWEEQTEKSNGQRTLFVELTETEQKIVDTLQGEESMDIDTLIFKMQLSSSVVSMNLLNLELKSVVKPLPGKRYILV